MKIERQLNWIFNLVAIVCSTFVFGCATHSYRIQQFDYPISDIQKAVTDHIPDGVAYVSTNRRAFYSKIFTVPGLHKSKTDLIMKIEIVGDRRPYDITFQVKKVEKMQAPVSELFDLGERYEGAESLSKRTALKIETSLTKRQKDKNLFDDFRPF